MQTELIKELSAKSKALDDLCSAFVERAHQIHCITTFYELYKFHGSIVSTSYYPTPMSSCDIVYRTLLSEDRAS